ncbi:phenylalanine--tRNA ligase subunit alpha [Paenactinomyces guangxiensis]|uniref:Phenylalanine--tRNA ligase alpha subunit n=1 Tax=Paenactinomyces guangxiensis TaxID=1490290 RepID=A0A7W1WR45_9BACL|nr:phenylalanine--tRNA ligase subunit alpha [Paenactinomyces guangxiensis]MBA4494543.1 phenylalanine--tRNA ligase subunit alpha [Paenactinomyces guangxiensis]MBH8591695.1 phenylalanine--tRNA ligase subunit alpha [Paenactinomyces guangxiensis]
MRERLQALKEEATEAIETVADLESLRELKVKYLGKKGELTGILRGMGKLSPEERPVIGSLANDIRGQLEELISEREASFEEKALSEKLHLEKIDVTLPGITHPVGSVHPLNLIIEQIEDIFVGMGFEVAEGPEIETDYYNFEALNFLKDHPARDMQDSFYFTPEMLLRTHTSPVQVRTLEAKEGYVPVRIICPGKVYRRDDDDATHSHQFTQIEGLVVDRGVSMSELNGVLLSFIEKIFGEGTEMRLRPSYFPFTEPSVEVDIYDPERGWIEILGAGMVHPRVLEKAGYNPERYTGFAFGMGVERIAMLKYGIEDIRHFYNNDLRFLRQFRSV